MYIRAFSHLVPPDVYLTRLATRINPLPGEEPQPPPEEKKTKKLTLEDVLAAMQEEPVEEEEEKAPRPKPKKHIYGRVIELEGDVYPMGSMTEMLLVNFVFSIENSGYFRDVAVDSATTLDDGRLFFKITCGI